VNPTPGPWIFARNVDAERFAKLTGNPLQPHDGFFRGNDGSWSVFDAEGKGLARVVFRGEAKHGKEYGSPDPEGQANACLISAAPDLFAALHNLLFQTLQGPVLERDAIITEARAAIAKASHA
jgi:hypothetical protein